MPRIQVEEEEIEGDDSATVRDDDDDNDDSGSEDSSHTAHEGVQVPLEHNMGTSNEGVQEFSQPIPHIEPQDGTHLERHELGNPEIFLSVISMR